MPIQTYPEPRERRLWILFLPDADFETHISECSINLTNNADQ
ncbi:protein of unknown function [Methylorubrum extorquens]|uniref:Uncharacterized protein n=1 Tax=Methylorubrum extorquens TaxID=408 RepID=A0A2N9AR46_METEX|nr:protein of unknown function [Methylorubrum extorquens]